MSDDEGKKKFKEKVEDLAKDKRVEKCVDYAWRHRLEIFYALLMVVGLIVSFFYVHIGGGLVGLATGLCFFPEVQKYMLRLREYYSEEGLYKTFMVIGIAIYLLIGLPSFLIATAIGFGIICLINWASK